MRSTMKLATALVLILSVAVLCAAGNGDPKKGKELFGTKCVTCHGDNGQGKPSIEKMFNVKMRALASKEVQSKTDEQLQKNILEGNGKMKAVTLTPVEGADVVAYLRTFAAEKK
jgi:mono/diheme cytochrome c family protein